MLLRTARNSRSGQTFAMTMKGIQTEKFLYIFQDICVLLRHSLSSPGSKVTSIFALLKYLQSKQVPEECGCLHFSPPLLT